MQSYLPYNSTENQIRAFFPFFLISYVCITCISIRSQCDLVNPFVALKVCGKKYLFSQSLKTCESFDHLEMNFILTIYHSKCKNQVKYFTLILMLSGCRQSQDHLIILRLMVSPRMGLIKKDCIFYIKR